jgi:DNA-binding HxlR family transcriptional regulator
MSKKPRPWRSDCPISVSLEIFGDRWTLLVVRDLMFKGRHEFKDFLSSEERIATNVLSERLKRLEAHQLVLRRQHPSDARRAEYHLTEKGIGLAPVLLDMIVWAATHETTAAPAAIVRRMRDDREGFLADLRGALRASLQRAR